MVNYEVTVRTGDYEGAATFNNVFITLVGTSGKSDQTLLTTDKLTLPFAQGQESSFTVSCTEPLGELTMIKLEKRPHDMYTAVDWFPEGVEVKDEDKNTYIFPIYCWIADSEEHSFPEGTACRGQHDGNVEVEWWFDTWNVEKQRRNYRWRVYKENLPYCVDADNVFALPSEVWFFMRNLGRSLDFLLTATSGLVELKLTGQGDCRKTWPNFEDIGRALTCKSTEMTKYIQKNWKEDAFFAHQFLNGINPMMIQRCTALPDNFPVTDDMVYLHGHSLADELKNGNIFLCDYKNLDGLKANIINGKQQYLTAPLVLLHKTPEDKLMPVAIQLNQTPGKDNPIFVPNDSPHDWLLAKTFVRSAEFCEHELNSHLLRTHLLAEVFTVSLMRNVSTKHPLYKLLMPHTRYTLQINVLARQNLISADGTFMKFTACGGEAMITFLERSLTSLTYRSLCIRDNIADRGLESLPNFHYRDDGFRLWDIIYRFVDGVLKCYYKTDEEVQQDPELQNWIGEIFTYGFLSQESTGIPATFTTVDEMVKFVTMVIFTCTAQHSAVNNGQYDYGGWMPNYPSSLQRPPPKEKGVANEGTLLQTLPDVSTTVNGMATLYLLSKQSFDTVLLGHPRESYFCETTPRELSKKFKKELNELHKGIKNRNETLQIPYVYLDPKVIENSVAL